MSIKEIVAGGVITLVIGGTAYSVNQADVVDNFANDTGFTQEQAQKYVENVDESDLVPYDKLGADYIKSGQEILADANTIDCINYEYEWQNVSLSCEKGKSQIIEFGEDEVALGQSYIVLSNDDADNLDINTTIRRIDKYNGSHEYEIITWMYGQEFVVDSKNNNSYNKSLLLAALQSQE